MLIKIKKHRREYIQKDILGQGGERHYKSYNNITEAAKKGPSKNIDN